MLQVARRGAAALGDSADLVRSFVRAGLGPSGAARDRAGKEDLYYTIFALACLQALDEPVPAAELRGFLRAFGKGDGLDFVHLGAFARCWAVVGDGDPGLRCAVLERLEQFRSGDGGYEAELGSVHGSAYGGFVALGAYQDLGASVPEGLRLVQSLKWLETPDGAWGNAPGMPVGSTNPTAAAVTLLHQLEVPVADHVSLWLRQRAHVHGGFLAMPSAPIPDLLSTATTLHALSCLDERVDGSLREKTLDFLDSLWSAEGGFHGHWADDELDVEYTFYGLLALGHLQ